MNTISLYLLSGAVINEVFSSLAVPFVVVFSIITLVVIFMLIARNYIKVPPNKAAFIFGRGGVKVITGGAAFRIPVLQQIEQLDITLIVIPDLRVENVANIDGIPVTVDGVVNIKFKSDEQSLRAAGERFLGKTQPEIIKFITATMEAALRGICGRMKIEEMIKDRAKFQEAVIEEAEKSLNIVGMGIDIFNIQNIADSRGYIQALGRGPTAAVIKEAEIAEATAHKESRIKATDAHKEGEVTAQRNIKMEYEAQRDTLVAKSMFDAEVAQAQAKAELAGPLQRNKLQQELIREQIKIDEEGTHAEIAVKEQTILREQKAQEAEVVVPAKAQADAKIKTAEGEKISRITTAEGAKQSRILEAEGNKEAIILAANAEKERLAAEGQGKGTAIKAEGEAEASIIELKGKAQGAAILAELKAKAEGLQQIAEAYKQIPEKGYMLEIMKLSPPVIDALSHVFGAISQPLGNIDRVTVYDSAGSDDKGALQRYAQMGPNILFDVVQKLEAQGFDVRGLLNKIGIQTVAPTQSSQTPRNE